MQLQAIDKIFLGLETPTNPFLELLHTHQYKKLFADCDAND